MDGSTTTRLEHRSAQLIDQFGRHKHKLRISLTDRCNFRCSSVSYTHLRAHET